MGYTVETITTGPAADTQSSLAEVLADVLRAERVPVDSHFFDDLGADSLVMAQFCARVRKRPDLPSVSIKDIYQHPTISSLATAFADAAPAPTETILAGMLADILGTERVPVDSHFFDDLGADSLVMAQFCARVRKRPDLPSVSIKDIYQHPTISSLATAFADAGPAPTESSAAAPIEVAKPVGRLQYLLCGTLQLLFYLGYAYLAAVAIVVGYEWIAAGSGLIDSYLRSALFGGGAFLVVCTLPILAKWVLVGRWKPKQIRIWSLAYFRFWFVKTLIRANPLVLFTGSPLYVLYLRALGAKVGRGVVILSRHLPVCTDLLTIGDGTVIRKDSFFLCYRAEAGLIQTGPVTLGRDVFISEATVLDIGTSMGDGAQLGHASSLHAGQAVPGGQSWHGSPAEPAEVDYRMAEAAACGTVRRAVYPALQLLAMLALYLPLLFGAVDVVLAMPQFHALTASLDFTSWGSYLDALVVSFVLFFGIVLAGLLFVCTVPRVLGLAIKPDKVYRLYGIHYSLHRAIARATNSKFLAALFGDSSYIVHYLSGLGYKLSPVMQTGSNFGMEVKHENPFLSSVGTGTQVASGLSIINADFSNTSFRVSRASIGPRNFLGNMIAYPSQGKTGDNCLLATKVMVPIDGKVREGVGLLGSPSFEIPRTVERDSKFKDMANGNDLRRRLAAKNRHNLVSIGLFLLARWFYTFVVVLILSWATGQEVRHGASAIALGALAIALAEILTLAFSVAHGVLVERASTGFRGLRPKYCSIYDIDFWRTERFFKLHGGALLNAMFNGTPFKSAIYRLLGVRLGRRLFDDGSGFAEKNLVTIGDDVTLNAGSYIQCHSQEDFAFKSDRITIGSGCTIGVGAMMLYGVTMGEGAVLAPDSFLMKGEEIPPNERWGGNPAREMPDTSLADRQLRRDTSYERAALSGAN
jgi:non-ribosomal peptide synthetase-like protein